MSDFGEPASKRRFLSAQEPTTPIQISSKIASSSNTRKRRRTVDGLRPARQDGATGRQPIVRRGGGDEFRQTGSRTEKAASADDDTGVAPGSSANSNCRRTAGFQWTVTVRAHPVVDVFRSTMGQKEQGHPTHPIPTPMGDSSPEVSD